MLFCSRNFFAKMLFFETEHNYIDFSKLNLFAHEKLSLQNNKLLLPIRNNQKGRIVQGNRSVDRCCKSAKPAGFDSTLRFSGKDEIPRISCDIEKTIFFRDYIQKRKPVMLKGCQKKWPARKWTFEGRFLPI